MRVRDSRTGPRILAELTYEISPPRPDPTLRSVDDHISGPGLPLSRWAADESPIQVLKIGDSLPHAAIDLDASPAVADPEQFYQLLAGAKGARGRIFATSDEAVAAAVRAGLKFIVSPQVLPALLSACTTRKPR